MAESLQDIRARLVSYVNKKAPFLNPDLLPLFKEHFHLTESDVAEIILKSQELKGTDSRKLAVSGFLNGKEADIPKEFMETLKTKGLVSSFAELKSSLKIDNVHLLSEKIKTFIARFYHDYQIPISINMYVTPSPEAPCFKPHCDLTEVFIFQLLGTKNWTFFCSENGDYLSGVDDKSALNETQLKQCIKKDVLIKPDEILHIPPLMYHEACATEGASVHLTISLNRLRMEHIMRILENTILEEMQMLKYKNLSNEEFEVLFDEALKQLDTDHFKTQLRAKKEQMMFLSRSQIILKGR